MTQMYLFWHIYLLSGYSARASTIWLTKLVIDTIVIRPGKNPWHIVYYNVIRSVLWFNWLTFAGWSWTGGAGGPGPGGPRSWALDCSPEMGVARIGFRAHLHPPPPATPILPAFQSRR